MFAKKPTKPGYESAKSIDRLPEVALAAIVSSKKQKDVTEFMSFFLDALNRNANWINSVIGKQSNFRCALMVGAGPNRFQLQELIYPSAEKDIKFEVELKDSDDCDKVAIVALLKLTNTEIDSLVKYIKRKLYFNPELAGDLQKGKALGVNFAVLRPLSEKQYRVMERIVIESSTNCMVPAPKKRKRDERSITKVLMKKTKTFL